MFAKSAYGSPSRHPTPRFRLSRNAKHLDMDMKDAKVALAIIIRPSLRLWKLALGCSALTALKRHKKLVLLGDDTSSTTSVTPKKRVRFDERPVTISRRGFFERCRKDSSSSPARPCLVIRLHDGVCHEPPEPRLGIDNHSIYEDCLSDHPGFLADLQVEGGEHSDTRPLKCVRRSEFYETESGIATFDRTGYANYCFSMWLDKQREELRAPKKLVFEEPVFLPWRTLSPPSSNTQNVACPVPPPPAPIRRPPRSLLRRISNTSTSSESQPRGRGRGRGKSRGGLGKYLRARGRGRSFGRPAEFTQRLVLEGEQPEDIDPEAAEEIHQRYSRRQLESNVDRYAEEEPQLDSEGEEIKEPEVDLSAFLERQRLSETAPALSGGPDALEEDEDEIDHSLAHITSQRQLTLQSKKGRVKTIEWDDSLEQMSREKAAAEANRDLKERFRAKTSTFRTMPMAPKERKKENDIVEAPPLPTEGTTVKDPKSEMQDFLDDLLG
ncbi:hypothetical protein OG21DRAFT_1485540 [Imleria badia]|nr:hypothetical protein OG21DRAFT_1485540 [Imleria badia]